MAWTGGAVLIDRTGTIHKRKARKDVVLSVPTPLQSDVLRNTTEIMKLLISRRGDHMKKISNMEFLKPLLGIVLGLCVTAVPGYCSLVLEFETLSSGGNITVNNENQNSTESLSSFSSVVFNEVQISGAANASDNGTWSITGSGLS